MGGGGGKGLSIGIHLILHLLSGSGFSWICFGCILRSTVVLFLSWLTLWPCVGPFCPHRRLALTYEEPTSASISGAANQISWERHMGLHCPPSRPSVWSSKRQQVRVLRFSVGWDMHYQHRQSVRLSTHRPTHPPTTEGPVLSAKLINSIHSVLVHLDG